MRESGLRPVSPELVLVDPELAEQARASLPERPWPPVPRTAAEGAAAVGRGRPFARILLGIAVASVAFGFLGLGFLPAADRPTLAPSGGELPLRASQQPAPVLQSRRPRRSGDVTRVATQPRTPRRSAAAAAPEARPVPPPRRAKRRTPRRQASTAVRQTPTGRDPTAVHLTRRPSFAWPPAPGAVYYQARFLRNGKSFYQARTRAPRVRLPARIRFPPGRYRWIVRPAIVSGSGIRLGNAIVDSTFEIDRE